MEAITDSVSPYIISAVHAQTLDLVHAELVWINGSDMLFGVLRWYIGHGGYAGRRETVRMVLQARHF